MLYRVTAPKHMLTKFQNRAARIITRADYKNSCPTNFRERFHRTSEIRDYNLRGSNYDLQLPLPKTNFLKRSFSYRGCNGLEPTVKSKT